MASRKNIKVVDLDRLVESGLSARWALAKCSVAFAIVQVYLILPGALMVRVATLLVSIGNCTALTTGIGVVSLPTFGSFRLGFSMIVSGITLHVLLWSDSDNKCKNIGEVDPSNSYPHSIRPAYWRYYLLRCCKGCTTYSERCIHSNRART